MYIERFDHTVHISIQSNINKLTILIFFLLYDLYI